MSQYVIREGSWPSEGLYFCGLRDGEEEVWTSRQKRALWFRHRDSAELVAGGLGRDARTVRVRASTSALPSEPK